MRDRLPVLHIMRTYGVHGGENQLASYLSAASQDDGIDEAFAFVFRDKACRALFEGRGVCTSLIDLWPNERSPSGAWNEVAGVLARLPVLHWQLASVLRRLKPRVCIVHGVQAAIVAWPFAMARRLSHRRFIYVHRTTKIIGRSALTRQLYRPFDVLAGNSTAVARSLDCLAQPNRAIALDNGVDLYRLDMRAAEPPSPALPASSVDLVAVGRLQLHKNQGFLIDSLARIVCKQPDIKMWIVGDGPDRSALEAQAQLLGVSENIVFLGHRADVPAVLARARVFVNASTREGMSNAVLEAMAMGLPSVVVDSPGVTECHEPGLTGFVVTPEPDAFAAATCHLLADTVTATEFGRRARARIEQHYAIEAARSRYLELFRRLVQENP